MIARMAYPQPPPGNQWWNQPPSSSPGYNPPPYPPRQTNALAIAALVCAVVFAPAGIVLGHIALSQIKRSGEEGRTMALAGVVVGYVFTFLYLVGIVLYVLIAVVWAGFLIHENRHQFERWPTTTRQGTYSMQSTAQTVSEAAGVLSLVKQ